MNDDVFISYAQIDDQPMMEGQRGWISQFHRSLEVRMAQLLGQEVKIWRDPKLQGSDLFDEALIRQFSNSKVLVSVLTPRYIRSESCRRELEAFIQHEIAPGLGELLSACASASSRGSTTSLTQFAPC